MTISNVVLVGADGKLGPTVLSHLASSGFNVTVLKRASSRSSNTYPSGVKTVRVEDDFSPSALVPVLKSQHAIVVTTAGSQIEVQRRLATAAVIAGVRRFIQADFGSCDSSSKRAQALVPLFAQKTELRGFLDGLARESHGKFTWSALVVGHFFDWSPEFLHLDVSNRRAEILDGGNVKFSITTLAQVARATVEVLRRERPTTDRMLFIQSCNVTQRKIVASLEKASGEKWEVNDLDSEAFIKEKKSAADEGEKEAIEDLVWALGTLEGNWESREFFAMEMLGLENENLDEITARIVKDHS